MGALAAWVGAVATMGVGVVAAIIARQQYLLQQFRPVVYAYADAAGRALVQVVNEKGGAGQVREITLRRFESPNLDEEAKWEVAGSPDPVDPRTPFLLPGLQTAQVVLRLDAGVDAGTVGVVVEYGHGEKTGLLPLVPLQGRFDGTTEIPERP
jgi:hypothetical protein